MTIEFWNSILRFISQPWIPAISNAIVIPLVFIWARYVSKRELEKLKAQYSQELELLRHQNKIVYKEQKAEIQHKKEETNKQRLKKLELCQKIDSLAYQGRNKAREIVHQIDKKSVYDAEKMNDLFKIQNNLVDFMYEEKYYLDKFSSIGEVIHSYKNILITFYESVSECQNQSNINKDEIKSKYSTLDTAFFSVTRHIQEDGPQGET
jgi:hypothetical protein